jgi:hypothetical protein
VTCGGVMGWWAPALYRRACEYVWATRSTWEASGGLGRSLRGQWSSVVMGIVCTRLVAPLRRRDRRVRPLEVIAGEQRGADRRGALHRVGVVAGALAGALEMLESREDHGFDPARSRHVAVWFPPNRGGLPYAASRSGAAVFS